MKKSYLNSERNTALFSKSSRAFRLLLMVLFVCFIGNVVSAQGTNCGGGTPATSIAIGGCATSDNITDTNQSGPTISGCSAGTFRREGWYTFTVTGGPLNVTITGIASNRNLFLQLISSTSACTGLSQIACANSINNDSAQTETISATLNNGIYYVKVVNVGTTNNDMALTSLCVTVDNDVCTGAIPLTSNTLCTPTTGSTIGATDNNETGDCATGTERAMWYQFTAVSTTQVVTVDGIAGFDAVIGAISTCGTTTVPTGGACVDATSGGGVETMTLTGLTIGSVYKIQVYDYEGDRTANGFTICITHSPPTISSFTPNNGCANATPVTITGTNFTGATAVRFGGTNAASFVVDSATQITATPAAGTTGAITVITPGGTATSGSNFTVTPNVGTPVFSLGATSTRCQGAGSVTYTATASNSTGLTYSLDATTLAFSGNSIDASSGAVTYAAGWSGTSIITASATGCSGPATATHTVTVTPIVGTPVFSLGATSSRCQGVGNVTYAATATNNTGLTYSLDATSLAFSGNSIVAGSGVVTYAAGWSGTSTITVSASGCNGPTTATHTVTINPRPTAFNVTGTGAYCSGGSGLAVGLSGSETGVDYQLYNGATPIGSPVAGTGSAITFGSQTGTTTYTVLATNATTSCTTTMTGSAVITLNQLPNNTVSSGFTGGSFCTGSQATLTFDADNTNGAPPYTLAYTDDLTGTSYTEIISTNAATTFNVAATTPRGYTLNSITNANGCVNLSPANNTTNVYFRPNPTATISGNEEVCQGAASPSITFTNPQAAGITITYTINGANQTVNVVANGTANVSVPTATAGPFVYALVSVDYSTNPACTQTLTDSVTVTVTATNTVTAASSSPTLCINTALLSPITHTTTGATGIGASTGLPTGVTASWASNTITISGTPSVSGTFNYSIPLTGGCGSVNATGTIIVLPDNTVSAASSSPTLCINTALTAITHTTTVATGIGTASGLPAGVTASWASNTITISGTPSESGTFGYSIPLIGGCGVTLYATGTIIVTPNNTVSAASSSPTLCIGTVLTSITHTTTGATGIGASTDLPTGVTASWASNTITISGTPAVAGTFNYSIPLTGGCGAFAATGTIIVTPENTVTTASSSPTICINTALTAITHTTTGATGIGVASGLPTGVTASWASNTITISGTPSVIGTFNYSIPLTGGCASVIATGTIIVDPNNTVSAASSSPTLCISTVLTAITHSTTGATGIGASTGLPTGVTASWASNTITISGTPTAAGTFNYSIPLIGGCANIYATGTITVNPLPAPAGAITGTTPVCQGQINVVYSVPAIANATTYIWTLPSGASISAGAGTNSIMVDYTMAAVSGNITVKGNNACGDGVISANYPVTVNITPNITSNFSTTACSGLPATVTPTNGGGNIVPVGTTYSWGLPSVTGGITGATALSGQTSFNQTLTNPTNTAQTASYNVTATTGGCSATTFSVLVTVNPKPVVLGTPSTQPICSGGAITPIAFTETSGVLGSINYNWTRTDATAITGISASGSGTITGNLTNTTNSPLTAIFRVIATTQNGCDSLPFDVSVVVNPTPTVAATPATQPICSGNPITAIALSNPNGVLGTTYSWTRDNTANVTGIAASGSGASIAGSLTNTTNTVQITTFTIKATANSCDSATTTVTVTVNPRPTVAVSTATQTICGNDAISPITITNPNNVAGTTFSWSRDKLVEVPANPGMIAASGTGNISGNLFNNTNSNQLVTFTVTATAAGCASTTTTSTVTVKPTPTVAISNSAQTICSASAITTMTITNPNTVAGTVYTWTRNNTTNLIGIAASGSGNTITGSLSHIPSSTTTQTTTFTITATSNGCSSTTTATVTVYPPLVVPVISNSQDVCNTQTPAAFYMSTPVTGGSGGYNYQWQRSAVNANSWSNAPGTSTNSTYTGSGSTEYDYRLIVSDSYCTTKTVTSNKVNINILGIGGILDQPSITNAPTSPVCNGVISPAIGVNISHTPLSNVKFNWYTNNAYITPTSGGPVGTTVTTGWFFGFPIEETTSYTFSFIAANTTNSTQTTIITISPEFSNGAGTCSSTPSNVSIQIRPTPTATATVPNTTICNGSSAGIVVKGNITDATTTLSWTRSVNANVSSTAATGSNTPAAFGGTYTIPDVLTNNSTAPQTVTYTITPSSNGCTGTPITTVTITINPTVTAGAIGTGQTICNNTNPSPLTSTTDGTGSGTISYEWQTNASGSYVTISGATGATYSPPALTATTSYQRRTVSVSGATCYSAYTTPVTITVNAVVTVGVIGTAQTICNGATPSPLTSTAAGTGSGTITYEWQTNASGSYVTIGGETGATYSPPALTATTSYQRRTKSVSGGTTCYSAYTTPITITVNAVVTAGAIGTAQTICNNTNPSTLTSTTDGTGSGIITYEWQTSASGSYVTISGATGATYSPPALTATTSYQRRSVSLSGGTTCYSVYTAPITITVIGTITSGAISGNRTICAGGDPSAFTETTPATGTGLTYQWQYSLVGGAGPWTDVSGATDETYDAPGPISQTTFYQRVVKASANGTDCYAYSGFVVVYVNNVTPSVISGNQSVCGSADPVAFTVSTAATGTGTLSYQWQSSTTSASGPWSNIPFATSAAYDAGPVAQTTYYQSVITSTLNGALCSTISNSVVVTYIALPPTPIVGVTTLPDCVTATGSVVLSGLPAGNWTINPGGITGNTPSVTISGLVANTYNFTVYNGTCTSLPTANVVIPVVTTAIWNGTTWTNGPPTINQPLEFTGSYDSSGDVTACSCTVTNGAVVFKPNNTLKITNWVHVNGGSLTFENTASLVQINNVSNTNSGNILYERETTKITKMDYTYWATPVSPFTLGGVSPNTSGDKMYSYDYSIDDWKQESPATSMIPGMGYIIRGPQNYVPPMPPSTYKAPFVGVPNNGHYEITGVIPDRSYLLGNPYPSALDADTFLDANQNVLDGTLYFWTHNTPIAIGTPDPGSGLYAYSGNDYASYNRTGGVSTAEPAPSSIPPFTGLNDNIPSGKIASGQGFFGGSKVSLPSNPKIVYDNTMRIGVGTITGNNSQFFKTRDSKTKTVTQLEKHRIWLNLTNIQGAFKQTLVGYVTDATNGYEDRFDGESYDGNDFLDFYSVNQDKNLTIQGRALPFDVNDEIPLGYRVALDGTFTIKIGKTDGLLNNQTVFLEDKLTNSVFNLKEGNYTFTTAAGTFDDRFVLLYTDKTLSTEDIVLNDGITVLYSNNYKTLIIRNNVKEATVNSVSLYNMAGQNIANWDVKGREQTSIQIPIKNLPSEIYIVKVKTTKGESSKKIIIK